MGTSVSPWFAVTLLFFNKAGLTLVHFSAQLEPCLTQENTLHTLHTLNTP